MIFNKEENFFMIIPRGNCKFVPKALNAQKAGAKLAIIMDNETYSDPFIMADNGEGINLLMKDIKLRFQQYSLIMQMERS